MSEQQADDESVEVPQDTGADAPDPSESDDSSGSSDSGSSDSGSSDSGSNDSDSSDPGGVSDEELPEDLQATEDNPLARHPRQTGDEDDKIGADSETGDAENPSASMTYGEDDDSDEGSNTSDESDDDSDS
jgi:hypothetical protein